MFIFEVVEQSQGFNYTTGTDVVHVRTATAETRTAVDPTENKETDGPYAIPVFVYQNNFVSREYLGCVCVKRSRDRDRCG